MNEFPEIKMSIAKYSNGYYRYQPTDKTREQHVLLTETVNMADYLDLMDTINPILELIGKDINRHKEGTYIVHSDVNMSYVSYAGRLILAEDDIVLLRNVHEDNVDKYCYIAEQVIKALAATGHLK